MPTSLLKVTLARLVRREYKYRDAMYKCTLYCTSQPTDALFTMIIILCFIPDSQIPSYILITLFLLNDATLLYRDEKYTTLFSGTTVYLL